MTFDCQPPFPCLSTFLLSAFFFFFFFLHSCSHFPASLLAKARLAQLWFLASPLRLEQTWTVPRWARTQLAGSVRRWLWGWWWSMDGCMDEWMDGHGLLACTLIFVCWCHALVSLSLSLCGLALTTVVFCRVCFPKVGPPVSQKMPSSSSVSFQNL